MQNDAREIHLHSVLNALEGPRKPRYRSCRYATQLGSLSGIAKDDILEQNSKFRERLFKQANENTSLRQKLLEMEDDLEFIKNEYALADVAFTRGNKGRKNGTIRCEVYMPDTNIHMKACDKYEKKSQNHAPSGKHRGNVKAKSIPNQYAKEEPQGNRCRLSRKSRQRAGQSPHRGLTKPISDSELSTTKEDLKLDLSGVSDTCVSGKGSADSIVSELVNTCNSASGDCNALVASLSEISVFSLTNTQRNRRKQDLGSATEELRLDLSSITDTATTQSPDRSTANETRLQEVSSDKEDLALHLWSHQDVNQIFSNKNRATSLDMNLETSDSCTKSLAGRPPVVRGSTDVQSLTGQVAPHQSSVVTHSVCDVGSTDTNGIQGDSRADGASNEGITDFESDHRKSKRKSSTDKSHGLLTQSSVAAGPINFDSAQGKDADKEPFSTGSSKKIVNTEGLGENASDKTVGKSKHNDSGQGKKSSSCSRDNSKRTQRKQACDNTPLSVEHTEKSSHRKNRMKNGQKKRTSASAKEVSNTCKTKTQKRINSREKALISIDASPATQLSENTKSTKTIVKSEHKKDAGYRDSRGESASSLEKRTPENKTIISVNPQSGFTEDIITIDIGIRRRSHKRRRARRRKAASEEPVTEMSRLYPSKEKGENLSLAFDTDSTTNKGNAHNT